VDQPLHGRHRERRVVMAEFEGHVDSIRRHKKSASDAVNSLRRDDLTDAAVRAQARADHAVLTGIADQLEKTRQERGKDLEAFKKVAVVSIRDEDFDRRIEQCEKALQQPIGLRKRLRTVEKQLHQYQVPDGVPVSASVAEIAKKVGSLAAAPTSEPAAETT
jgi:hypothetical protein